MPDTRTNNYGRVYYGLQQVLVQGRRTCPGDTYVGGVSTLFQSIGINASTEYEQIFELGRAGIYNNIEGIPTAEVTVERAMTAETFGALWYQGPTTSVSDIGATDYKITMAISPENNLCSSGPTSGFVVISGAVLTNYTMNFNLDGPLTESATYEADNISWTEGNATLVASISATRQHLYRNPSGVILTRANVEGSGPYGGELQSATFSISLDRENILTLGQKYPVMKPVSFPVEATAEFEYLVGSSGTTYGLAFAPDRMGNVPQPGGTKGDGQFDAVTLGIVARADADTPAYISLLAPYLTSSSYSGGDAGGGNATITHTFTGYDGIVVGSGNISLDQLNTSFL